MDQMSQNSENPSQLAKMNQNSDNVNPEKRKTLIIILTKWKWHNHYFANESEINYRNM